MRLYLLLDRLGRPRSYLGKIFLVSFIGVHVPLIGAIAYLLIGSNQSLANAYGVLAALLVATLIGTGGTMAALYALLAPVREAAEAMKGYLREKTVPQLPTRLADQAGVLMANVQEGVTRLDAALDAAHTRLQAAERESHRTFNLLSSLSHELRTPLNHIIGFAEMMSTEALGPLGKPEYKNYALDIGASGGQLLSTLQAVLDLSQAASDKATLAPSSLTLADTVGAAARLVHLEAQARDVKLRVSGPDAARVHADPRALKQILIHGMAGAIETPAPARLVTVVGNSQGGTAVIEIAHSGADWTDGDLPPQMQALLPEAQRRSGTDSATISSISAQALRLAVIHSLVTASGGDVHIRKAEQGGRVLRLTLPAAAGIRLTRAV